MKKILYFAAVLSAFMTSCTSENEIIDNTSTKGTSTITAAFDQPATRAQMGTSDGTNTPLQWNAGDWLVVYNATSKTYGLYKTASSVQDGDAEAVFDFVAATGSNEIVPAQPHLAVYPYARIKPANSAFIYSSSQTYTENSFDRLAMPMVASNASGTEFNNFTAQAAVLRLKVSTTASDVTVSSIDIESASMALTGDAAPNMTLGTYGVPTESTSNKVTLNCATPVAISSTATEFNIVVPGQTYPSGDLTITVRTNKGFFKKTSKAEATFAAGKVYNLNISGEPVANTPDPDIFTLTATGDKATIRINHSGLQYQTTNQEWSPYTSYTWISLEDGQFIQFKAADGAMHTTVKKSFEINGPVEASGSVMTLLPDGTEMGTSAFKELFKNCTGLKTASEVELLAETLTSNCYQSMFEGCTSLETAPTLPATSLASYCYRYMFKGCTSLETAPTLPAISMANSCYDSMFEGCTSLETAPELPATSLITYCYTNMFKGCSNLCEIHVSFTSWTSATTGWVDGVSSNGIFYCPSSLADHYGNDKVPTGWEINKD